MPLPEIISRINSFIWGPAMLILLIGTGVFLMIRLDFLPLRNLGYAFRQAFIRQKGNSSGDISPFQSLMTTLAATIGVGNIAGVATAMVLGGAGALLWMAVSAIFALSTKYGESVLAVRFRVKNKNGEMAGGPMYVLKNGFPIKRLGGFLAVLFSIFTIISTLGIGNFTQSNTLAIAFGITFSIDPWIICLITAVITGAILVGGIKSIGRVCGLLVPIMAIFYIAGSVWVIFCNIQNLPSGILQILKQAFSFQAMGGGAAGTVIANSIRFGVARGVSSNEAGLGTAPIAAAAAKTDHPSRQGYINMTGVFIDTIVVCMLTGLAIASSGVLGTVDSAGNPITGAALTIAAFESAMGTAGKYIVTLSIALFAFSTLIGCEYYGEKCLEFLLGSSNANNIYRIIYSSVIFFGSFASLDIVWNLSDTINGLMAIPNLICILVMSGIIAKECNDYQKRIIRGFSTRTSGIKHRKI